MAMLDITINVGCKINCLYCPQHNFVHEYTKRSNVLEMSFENFKTCIDKVPNDVGLSFGGFSEPWLNHDCTKMLLYAHKKGHKCIHVSTTLVGMTLADIGLLEEIPIEAFKVHLPGNDGYETIDIDENYMNVLKKIRKSKIKTTYRYHGNGLHPKIKSLVGNDAFRVITIPRSVCVPDVVDISSPRKKRGIITCRYAGDLRFNELLPNGDVLLCCQDFGMRHILGNLFKQGYESLFKGEEFLKVKEGLKNNSAEIICRYCLVSCNVNTDFSYFINLLNTDVIILICKARVFLKKHPLLNKKITERLLKILGIDKFKIDFGTETLDS